MILLHILWPTFAMVALCFAVFMTLAVRRMGHVKASPPRREDFASDAAYRRRLLARDGWGSPIRPATRFGFYVRSHWLRMPPYLLARHLWIKWRRGAPA